VSLYATKQPLPPAHPHEQEVTTAASTVVTELGVLHVLAKLKAWTPPRHAALFLLKRKKKKERV